MKQEKGNVKRGRDESDLMIEAYALRSAGMTNDALDKCHEAVELCGGREDMVLLAHRFMRQIGEVERSAEFLRPFVAKHNDKPRLATALAGTLYRLGEIDEAVNLYRMVLDRVPDHVDAAGSLAFIKFKQGESDTASQVFEDAALASDDPFRVLGRAASMFAQLGQIQRAEHFLQGAEALGPLDNDLQHTAIAIRQENVPERASAEYVTEIFDKHAPSFDQNLHSLGYSGPQLIARAVGDLGLDPGTELDVLDAGCGTGLCGPAVRPIAKNLVGVDLSDQMLRLADEKGCYDELLNLDIVELHTKFSESFDLLISADVLGYFGPLVDVLSAYRRCLRSGGHAIVTVEAAPDEAGPEGYKMQPTGRYCHTEEHLRKATIKAGFAQIDQVFRDKLRYEFEEPVEAIVLVASVVDLGGSDAQF